MLKALRVLLRVLLRMLMQRIPMQRMLMQRIPMPRMLIPNPLLLPKKALMLMVLL